MGETGWNDEFTWRRIRIAEHTVDVPVLQILI